MTINDIKKRLRQAQLDAAEALFEQNPTRFMEKYVEVSESRFTQSLPGRTNHKKKQKP